MMISTFKNLELSPWILAPGSVGDSCITGGNVPEAIQSQRPPFLALNPKGKSYANAYFYKTFGARPEVDTYIYRASIYMPNESDSAASQAVEFDIQQVINQVVFNSGFQLDFAESMFRVWNRDEHERGGPNQWNSVGIPLNRLKPGTWNSLTMVAMRDESQIHYAWVRLGLRLYMLGKTYPAPTIAGQDDMMNCAIQLDGNQNGNPYHVSLRSVSLTLAQFH